jgi:hypothetical protein
MHKRYTSLSFIIGLFFLIVSAILLIGYFTSDVLSVNINLYAAIAFLLFGVFMITRNNDDAH